jgi:hypothetical protein
MSGRHSHVATHQRRASRTPVVVIGVVLVAAVVGVVVAMVLRSGSSSKPSPITRANDAAAQSDARNAVAAIEQCHADSGRYPASVDAMTGAVAGCTSVTASLSAGDSIAYFASPSADGYIFTVTNTTGGVSGKAFCYSSQQGSVVALPSALTAWRASC